MRHLLLALLFMGPLALAQAASYDVPTADESSAGDEGGNTGWIPSRVSMPMLPPPATEVDITMALLKGIIKTNCFKDDCYIDFDTCQIGPIPFGCVRITCPWPYGIMEATNKIAHASMNVSAYINDLRKRAGKVLPISKLRHGIRVNDKASESHEAMPIGRAAPLPLGGTILTAMVTVVSLGQFCNADLTLVSNAMSYWYAGDNDSAWKAHLSPTIFSYLGWHDQVLSNWIFVYGGLSNGDLMGTMSHSQTGNLLIRGSHSNGGIHASLLDNARVAWQAIGAPPLMYGPLQTDLGGLLRLPLHDKAAYGITGPIALAPQMVPGGCRVQVLYPTIPSKTKGAGCPNDDCARFFGFGQMGTPQRWVTKFTSERMTGLYGTEYSVATAIWPFITCCRLCQIDIPKSAAMVPIVGKGFIPQLVLFKLAKGTNIGKKSENPKVAAQQKKMKTAMTAQSAEMNSKISAASNVQAAVPGGTLDSPAASPSTMACGGIGK